MEPEIKDETPLLEGGAPEIVDAEVASSVVEVLPLTGVVSPRTSGRSSMRARAPRSSGRTRAPRERGEFEQVTIDARRVARVMAGGRRFNFSLVIVIGDKKGRVGVGLGNSAASR